MTWLGYLELACLTGLAFLAALAISVRIRWAGRAELLVGVTVLTHALITLPTLALGWSNLLYPSTLAVASAAVSLTALALTMVGRKPRILRAEVRAAMVAIARLPYDAFGVALRQPTLVLLGLVSMVGALVWTAWASYLAPSSSWDGTWYHETIVGYALQNHGFEFIKLPSSLTYVNSFPRVCEMLNLWFVIFTNRRLVEVVNTVMAPTLVLSMYAIVRRYCDRVTAMGWSVVLLLVPAVAFQMRSTYIDLHVASLALAALLFATRVRYRLRDAAVSAVCLALLLGTKYHAWMWVPFIACVQSGRILLNHARSRPLAAWATILGTLGLMAAIAGPQHVRNWTRYHNPFFPIAIDIERAGIHWPGYQKIDDIRRPFGEALVESYTVHVPGKDYCDTKVHSYGMAIPWIVLPIATIALPAALFLLLRGRLFKTRRHDDAGNLLMTVLPVLLTAPLSPALWLGRYNIHVAAGLIITAAWGASRSRLRRFGEGALGAAIVVSLMFLWWADPGLGGLSHALVAGAAQLPPDQRATYDWPMYPVPTKTALAREHELRKGVVVAFTDTNTFPSLLWNDHFSNLVVYVPFEGPEAFDRRLVEVNAHWAVAVPGTAEFAALRAASDKWEEIGLMTSTEAWTAFRRRS